MLIMRLAKGQQRELTFLGVRLFVIWSTLRISQDPIFNRDAISDRQSSRLFVSAMSLKHAQ